MRRVKILTLVIAAAVCVPMLLQVLHGQDAAPEVKYLGSKSCKKCHIKQYKSWEATNMAKAYETLKQGVKADVKAKFGLEDKDYTQDASCLKCHTVGYGKPGGFDPASPDENLMGVGCESCHGPGSSYAVVMKEHKKDYKLQDLIDNHGLIKPDENNCKSCHNADSPTVEEGFEFDYEANKDKGTHDHLPLKYEH